MLSKEEFAQKVIELSKAAGDSPEVMDSLKELQDSYNESVDASPNQRGYTDADVMDKDGRRWQDKYNEAITEYRNRFFGGGDTPKEDEPVDLPGDPGKPGDDPASVTFDDLFTERT